jgi:hypothetical protein
VGDKAVPPRVVEDGDGERGQVARDQGEHGPTPFQASSRASGQRRGVRPARRRTL